jgi:predicted DNA-binding transcriptional regulator YafY
VWQDRRVQLTRALRYGPLTDARVEQAVDPYGLVAKANVWHLVCAQEGRLQAYRVSHILDARLLDERFARPPDFDLASFWAEWCAEFERGRAGYEVAARISPQAAPMLDVYLGARAAGAGPAPRDADGWLTARLVFESLEEARGRLLALGGAVEVLAPEALRRSMADFAARIIERYAGS